MHLSRLIAAIVMLALSTGAAWAQDAAARLAEYRSSPPLLRAFLFRMPKGGDLHNHLSGAAYAEATIRAAAAAGLCVNPDTAQVLRPPCTAPVRPMADAVTDAALNRIVVNAWSMRDFVPASGLSGHDHFFNAFSKFGGAAPLGDMAAEVVNRARRAGRQSVEDATINRRSRRVRRRFTRRRHWRRGGTGQQRHRYCRAAPARRA